MSRMLAVAPIARRATIHASIGFTLAATLVACSGRPAAPDAALTRDLDLAARTAPPSNLPSTTTEMNVVRVGTTTAAPDVRSDARLEQALVQLPDGRYQQVYVLRQPAAAKVEPDEEREEREERPAPVRRRVRRSYAPAASAPAPAPAPQVVKRHTKRDMLIGAMAGAITGRNAVGGAIGGAILGGIIGHNVDVQRH